MTEEALKLALETLEADPLEMVADANGHMVFLKDKAITTIKEHLEEKALQALHDENERLGLYKDAYAEQEPMAWISTGPARMIHWTSDKPAYGDDWVPLYTAPPPCPTCEALARTVMMDQRTQGDKNDA